MKENTAIKKRFVSDMNIPINVFDEPYFSYYINLYEDYFKSKTKWDDLVQTIDNRFNGSPEQFLEEYAKVRDKIITDLLDNESYKDFISKDLSEYDIPNRNFPSSNVYKETNKDRVFVSIDLKKANFQALKFVGVITDNTYEDFINRYTDLDYIKKSKYTRQVIFGKTNPKRQIKVEHFLIDKVYQLLCSFFEENYFNSFVVESFCTDEIVISIGNNYKECYNIIFDKFSKKVKEELNIDVDVEIYQLNLIKFKTYNNITIPVYSKRFIIGDKIDEIMTVPSFYFAQVYKLLKGDDINDYDLVFYMENQLASFNNKIKIDGTD